MGNRAIITTKEQLDKNGFGLYLHWNGGRDSVEGFLKYCKLKGYRGPESDVGYGLARLCCVICNFFGDSLSIGIEGGISRDTNFTSWLDNGIYVVGKNWNIVERVGISESFSEQSFESKEMNLDFLKAVDDCQPEPLGYDILEAMIKRDKNYKDKLLNCYTGTKVAVYDYINDAYKETDIVGFGKEGRILNGHDVSNIPYVNLYFGEGDNINNYLTEYEEFYIMD